MTESFVIRRNGDEITLTPEEVKHAYEHQRALYQEEDAKRHLADFGDDNKQYAGVIKKLDANDLSGLACIFENRQDCNRAENDIWESVIEDYLNPTFRMYAKVKMSRPVDKEKDYISPGGYWMDFGGKDIQFDFCESATTIDDKDASILHIELKNPDYEEFEELKLLDVKDLEQVKSIPEFFIYTGEKCETDLRPIELLELGFILPFRCFCKIRVPEDIVKDAVLACEL